MKESTDLLPKEEAEALEKIKDSINPSHHIIQAALMTNTSYSKNEKHLNRYISELKSQDAEIVLLTQLTLKKEDPLHKNNFRVAIIRQEKEERIKLTLSFAGTNPLSLSDLKADKGLLNNEIPKKEQLEQLASFLVDNLTAEDLSNIDLEIVGHSLGGTLAQLFPIVLIKELTKRKLPIPENLSCIVFDSPGCKAQFETLCKEYELDSKTDVMEKVNYEIYNAPPNVINQVGEHLVPVHTVTTERDNGQIPVWKQVIQGLIKTSSKSDSDEQSLKKLSILNIILQIFDMLLKIEGPIKTLKDHRGIIKIDRTNKAVTVTAPDGTTQKIPAAHKKPLKTPALGG